jgi:predicted O-methyltransferase YrrM
LNIVDPRLERYLEGLLDDPDPVQREMEELARQRGFPIVGPLVGRLLMLLAKATSARRILELGSGFGYSALWFARALPDDGEIILTEYDSEDSERSREFLVAAALAERATFLVGDALQLVASVAGPFDIIFNDVDKEQYPAALEKALPKLRPGGLLITDNVLWQGRVVDENPPEPSTAGVLEFNRRIHADPRLEVAMVPLRDGLAICRLRP